MFPGYSPYAPHGALHAPDEGPPADVLCRAAEDAGAMYISADGLRAYTLRFGAVLEAQWNGAAFGAWWPVAEIPTGAVRIE